MLTISHHETIMKNILRDLYIHPELQAQLAFKGGTCLYLFHGLTRFSTDLDFNLKVAVNLKEINPSLITGILKQYLKIEDQYVKRFTLFWFGSYEKNEQGIKLEINKREYRSDTYQENDFFGLTIPSLDLPTMFAHKLCAITDRNELVNRDLYDAWWLFKKFIPINEAVIQERMNTKLVDYLKSLPEYIVTHVKKDYILSGLGELLTSSQKDWVRDHLLKELLFQIEIKIQELSNWNFSREFTAQKQTGLSDSAALEATRKQLNFQDDLLKAMADQYRDKK